MPFESDKQKKYLAINKPDVYNKYKKHSKLKKALLEPKKARQTIKIGEGPTAVRFTQVAKRSK